MKTIFSLFENYKDCEAAVGELLDEEFDEDIMNVIVQSEVAKSYMDVNLERVQVNVTEDLGEAAMGLDVLLGLEQPVEIHKLGDVYAAGEIATILAKTAAVPGKLEQTLAEFGIPHALTGEFVEALSNGAVLFWLRAQDARAGQAGEILRVHHGMHVRDYTG